MIIKYKIIEGKELNWILRCPTKDDAEELSILRILIDGETENLDREPGEALLTTDDFKRIIYEDNSSKTAIFLVADVNGKIVGFARCVGNNLSRFKHKAEFGICILKEYWGNGIGKVLMKNILMQMETVDIKKISLNVVQTNTKAIEMYKKFGFIQEGVLMNDRIHKDGNYYNTLIMGKMLK